ncbi:MAG: hypothetical protein M4579_005039 [Chaenotheca gracillima]|nr:MAG: hypothetical protein M4579_005039 [Chaenotheca gracillima]
MPSIRAFLSGLVVAALATSTTASGSKCKCSPHDKCWPTDADWKAFNKTLNGALIKTVLPAAVCYPGPQMNAAACQTVDSLWTNSTYQAESPVGYDYPYWTGSSCLPVNASAGEKPTGECTIGKLPWYSIEATDPSLVVKGVNFARKNNIRLVIKNTGHDLLGRSAGYGSLNIWTYHLRQGVTFQKKYKSSNKCSKTTWTGSAYSVGGGYVWSDLYARAKQDNVVVVGGGNPGVSVTGGWMQGGGHSPASHDFGLGADQLLEAQVVVADGELVTANACSNPDLYFALRGGGGGTYGVVVSAVIKAHPETSVAAQTFSVVPKTTSDKDTDALFDAITTIHNYFPFLSDNGYSGYGSWGIQGPTPLTGNSTTGYIHDIAIFGKSIQTAQKVFAPVAKDLQKYSKSLTVETHYTLFKSYTDYYTNQSGVYGAVGSNALLGSRFFDKAALTSPKLKNTLKTIGGNPGEYTSINLELVAGGQVAKDKSDQYSGVNPAWRTAYLHNIVARGWLDSTPQADITAIENDVTYKKLGAMKALAPNTGCYMNEADPLDPDYKIDFYGSHYDRLSCIKDFYDPHGVFYCPTCVNSDKFTESANGELCLK